MGLLFFGGVFVDQLRLKYNDATVVDLAQVGLCILLLLVGANSQAATVGNAAATAVEPPYSIAVSKGERTLKVMRFGKVVRSYYMSSGSEQGGKVRRGDKRTPVGSYSVLEVRPSDRYHIFMHLDYPGMHDAAKAYGEDRIDAVQYQKIRAAHSTSRLPPQNTLLGGQIGIHGLGEAVRLGAYHDRYNWTKGCIAVTDKVIEELKKYYIRPGTIVTISE